MKEVTDFFRDISSPDYKILSDKHKEKLVIAFKLQELDKNKIDETINIIHNRLKEIAGVYIFLSRFVQRFQTWTQSMVWICSRDTKKQFPFLYYEKECTYGYKMDYLPLDDSVSTDYIMPRSKDCQTLFELILRFNKSIV